MKYHKFTLKTLSEAEEIVMSSLADAGVEGVEIEDKVPLTESDKQQMFVDILPEGAPDDGVAYLSFYIEEGADREALLARVKEELDDLRMFMDIGEGTITESETEDKDWINNWKQYFHQFYANTGIFIAMFAALLVTASISAFAGCKMLKKQFAGVATEARS